MKTITVTESQLLELASELAYERAMDNLFADDIISRNEDAYCEDASGVIVYTKEMQEEFDTCYDYYLSFVKSYLK